MLLQATCCQCSLQDCLARLGDDLPSGKAKQMEQCRLKGVLGIGIFGVAGSERYRMFEPYPFPFNSQLRCKEARSLSVNRLPVLDIIVQGCL
jgi:hypothetical protein